MYVEGCLAGSSNYALSTPRILFRAETRELDGVAALRPERDVPADADKGVDVAHRRSGSDPAFYDTLVELFDAVMETFG
ncbi:hypothetical protein [Streptomyces sp. ZS0098]|uniref:hypothetical protein n=1 Tax=Streptomyces sp. ZS0098 TaxID=1904044 RepID=UPI0011C470FD|nr:hypothetical protein [Streptomyces sp. ZS0098]